MDSKQDEIRFLWAMPHPDGGVPLVEAVGAELGLTTRFCTLDDLREVSRIAPPNVVAIQFGADAQAGLAVVRETASRLPQASVLAASPHLDLATIRAALGEGASDVVALPLERDDLARALLRAVQGAPRPAPRPPSGEVIAIYGVRGGLGATTLAVNLAARLQADGAGGTALVDLDLQRGDVAVFLNLAPTQSLAQVAKASAEIDDVFVRSTLTRHASGLVVLAAPPAIEDADTVGHGHVETVLRVLRGQVRHIVVDTPRTITGAALAAFERADRILVITDLSVPSVRAARRTLELLERLDVRSGQIDLLVTNTAGGAVDVKEAARVIGREPLAVIPRDAAAASAAMNGGTPLNGRPTALASAIAGLAEGFLGSTSREVSRGHFLRRLFMRDSQP